MHSGSNAAEATRALFGGCGRLLIQYRTIGAALRDFERRSYLPSFARIQRSAHKDLRATLSTVPVEVLESYLDDLLDLELEDGRLFIERPGVRAPNAARLFGAVLGACLFGGALALLNQTSPLTATLLGGIIASAMFGFCLSSHPASRRMRFANIISQEANRRRGNPRDGMPRNPVVQFPQFTHLTTVH
ncbi:MAG: hypothetical protein EBZ48_04645 [Proteobacteria bacterium]|nr:hypothetical protein [Pseudomonadota bacterium]